LSVLGFLSLIFS